MTTDPKTIWLEPRCEGCPAGAPNRGLRGGLWHIRPKPCPTCGKQSTEYRRMEE